MAGASAQTVSPREWTDAQRRSPARSDTAPTARSSLWRDHFAPWPVPEPRHERPAPVGLLAHGSSIDAHLPRLWP